MNAIVEVTFCGPRFTAQQVEPMGVVARDHAGLGVTEIARIICELRGAVLAPSAALREQ